MSGLDWGCRTVAQLPDFAAAGSVLEIGGGDFGRVRALAERFPDKRFLSVDLVFSPAARDGLPSLLALDNVNVLRDPDPLRLLADGSFDFAFSIAVMEHVAALDPFLARLHAVLRPGAAYWFHQEPFWTSPSGHHYRHDEPAVTRHLDAYQHLLFDAVQMRAYLDAIPDRPFETAECVRKIYRRPDLSRLSPGETHEIVRRSPFRIEQWDERALDAIDETAAAQVLARYGERYSRRDLSVRAVRALLRRV
ncbi:MAG: class I SAM-dependent methyltransferase [Alphaproteobacteria bacterium]